MYWMLWKEEKSEYEWQRVGVVEDLRETKRTGETVQSIVQKFLYRKRNISWEDIWVFPSKKTIQFSKTKKNLKC